MELSVKRVVQCAEANADPEVPFAAEELDQRNGEFPRRNRVFAGLKIHVRDGGRKVVQEQIREFVEFGAITVQIAIRAAHSAVMAVFPTEIGEFHNGADEDFRAKMLAGG